MRKIAIAILLSFTMVLVVASQAQAATMGIDISKAQGSIDWDTLLTSTDFVIMKAGGGNIGLYPDPQFGRNQLEARRVGIARGYYYFAGGSDPVAEADYFYGLVGKLQPGEVVALDFEVDHPDPVGYSLAFLQRAEQLFGVKPLLYTNMNRIWTHDWRAVSTNGYPLWGAIYDDDHNVMPLAGAWSVPAIKQFSDAGALPGIGENPVDLDVLNTDVVADFKSLGMSGVAVKPDYMGGIDNKPAAPKPAEVTPPPAEAPTPPAEPKVESPPADSDKMKTQPAETPAALETAPVAAPAQQEENKPFGWVINPIAIPTAVADSNEVTGFDPGTPSSAFGSSICSFISGLFGGGSSSDGGDQVQADSPDKALDAAPDSGQPPDGPQASLDGPGAQRAPLFDAGQALDALADTSAANVR
ncbi:MAG: glycoside hydrolase family 25 protein [Actinobacteria bacterium]|nr:glycoside hydrolase family 25 protein [Actinomycetota bacterium]MCL5882883.1 glycoside hydrolase family 25 protein [Actinomycetota bacterium]